MDSRVKELIQQGDTLFSYRSSLNTLWQEIAENFYPERADFTTQRIIGAEFASNLLTSYPIMARRDLGNSFSTMLRPTQTPWLNMTVEEHRRTNDAKRWLEYATGVQKRAMYDRKSNFNRASKEGDHDFAAFGQCVKTVELNKRADGLLYRCWHLRDVAWAENCEGEVDTIHRKWAPFAIELAQQFSDTASPKLLEKAEKTPYTKVNTRHIVVPSEYYRGAKKFRTPYVSIYMDVDHESVLEEIGVFSKMYWIPRWQTVSGSQYSYSPATVAALPDARLIQAMTLTLLEAGEKAANPPMVAVQEAIRGDIALYAGAVTYVDAEYDERLGEVLRPITQNMQGMPIGRDLRNDIRQMISEAFFLNKIALPPMGNMTAFETSQRVQEYIRQALPLFEPIEMEDNGPMADMTFDLLLRGGAFGSMQDMPPELRGAEVKFEFISPLRDSEEKQKGALFLQAKEMLAAAVALDPGAAGMVDSRTALRETLEAIGVPAKWVHDEKQMEQIDQINAQKEQAQQLLQTMQAGAGVAKTMGEAGQAMNGAGMM